MKDIVTINVNNQGDFVRQVQAYLKDDYKLSSSNCGFVNSEAYDFIDRWQAILYKED